MSDERRESLAEQAAGWIPPWARPRPAEQVSPVEPSGAPETVNAPEPVTAAAPEVAGAPEPVTAAALEAAGASEPVTAASTVEEAATPTPAEPAEPGVSSGSTAPARRSDPPALTDDGELQAALEAILLVVDEPATEVVLGQVLGQPTERITATLHRLAREYTETGRGFELRRAAGGWRLYTRPEYASYVERFVLDGQSVRLTQAALEALAVVAYKQPVTRSRISAIRGVNSDGVVRTLVSRGLIEECGTEPDSGAYLYRTTPLFLEKLGLDRLDELPPLAPFLPDNLEEIADATR